MKQIISCNKTLITTPKIIIGPIILKVIPTRFWFSNWQVVFQNRLVEHLIINIFTRATHSWKILIISPHSKKYIWYSPQDSYKEPSLLDFLCLQMYVRIYPTLPYSFFFKQKL